MPVSRYRSVEEMPPPPRATGAELARRIRAVLSRAIRLGESGRVRGVQRFRDIEEAGRSRDAVADERMREQRAQREADPEAG